MNKYERMGKLAEVMDRRYKELKQQKIRFTMIYDMVNTELINTTYSYYYNELKLKEHHPWKFSYDLKDNGGVYDDVSKSISLNYDIVRPADYLLAGLDTNDECKKEQYFNIGIELLSCVVHELRHAWQDEQGLLQGLKYVSAEEDYEKYRTQKIEIDAREYQSHFFTEGLFKFILNNYR